METPPVSTPYLEIKRKPGGVELRYETELLYRTANVVVVHFLMRKGGGQPAIPVNVPPGSVSLGYFWRGRPFNLYRWRDPAGDVLAHRFDAIADLELGPHQLVYRDLILDWWVLPGDVLLEEDREEFEDAVRLGTISRRDAEIAGEAARQVLSRYRHIIDEAADLERRLIGTPGA